MINRIMTMIELDEMIKKEAVPQDWEGLLLIDRQEEGQHEAIRSISKKVFIPIHYIGEIKRFEDVKKALYAGAHKVFIDLFAHQDTKVIRESIERFGSQRIGGYIRLNNQFNAKCFTWAKAAGIDSLVLLMGTELMSSQYQTWVEELSKDFKLHLEYAKDQDSVKYSLGTELLVNEKLSPSTIRANEKDNGLIFYQQQSAISFATFKLNENGLIPVITMDTHTKEPLMLAYMNQEAFDKTISSGKMTYYSRSRNCQWTKGEESGHLQYVEKLMLDCDKDTILAYVKQVGPACHTGSQTCFYQTLFATDTITEKTPFHILTALYETIEERKKTPKEGSYTNYLLDKGIDKILKKMGEEATEITIAAKNPDPEEIKYEIADYLYHLSVLMVDKGVTWDDVMNELANR